MRGSLKGECKGHSCRLPPCHPSPGAWWGALQPSRRGPAAPSPPAAGPHLFLGRWLRRRRPCPLAAPPKPRVLWKRAGVSWKEDTTGMGVTGSPRDAHEVGGAALPPQPWRAPPAGLFGSGLRQPPSHLGDQRSYPRPGRPSLGPRRCIRAPPGCPHPHSLHLSPPPSIQAQPAPHPCSVAALQERGRERVSRCRRPRAPSPW